MEHFNDLGGLIHACPVPEPILGLVEPALITHWLMGLPRRHRPAAPASLTGLPQVCLGSGGQPAGEASCRRSQPRGLRGKAGEGKASFLPHRHLILQPWVRGAGGSAGQAEGTRTGQPDPVSPVPLVPSGPSTSTTSTASILVRRRRNSPDRCFTRAVSTNGWPKARPAAGCKPPARAGGTCHLC